MSAEPTRGELALGDALAGALEDTGTRIVGKASARSVGRRMEELLAAAGWRLAWSANGRSPWHWGDETEEIET